MMQANRGKRVHIIATGGTIAGVGEAGFTGGYQPGVLSIGRWRACPRWNRWPTSPASSSPA